MLEWEIVDEFDPIEREPQASPPRRRRSWLLWVALLLLVGAGLALWDRLQAQEQRLLADITEVVLREERALRGEDVAARWYRLADSKVPSDWEEGYRTIFGKGSQTLPMPQVTVLALEDDSVLVRLTYAQEELFWQTLRAYRLVGQGWLRTPVDGFLQKSSRATMVQGDGFQIVASEEDMRFLEEHPEWWLDVGTIQEQLRASWPQSCEGCTLHLTLHTQEFGLFSLVPTTTLDRLSLLVPSPLLFQPDWDSPLPPSSQYRLAVAAAVIDAHTYPRRASGDDLTLLQMLQQAEARQWALDENERRIVRNEWRHELNGQWPKPLEGFLPKLPKYGPPEQRARWLVVNLLIERQIALGGPETPEKLARILLSYQPSLFQWESFFQALIGGSMSDLETLSRDYVLTMEP